MNVYSHKYREDEWKSFDQDFVKAIFNGDKLVAFWWVSFLEQLLQEIIVFVGQSLKSYVTTYKKRNGEGPLRVMIFAKIFSSL